MPEETNVTDQTEGSQDICCNRARLIPVPKQDIVIGRGDKDALTARQGNQ